MSAQFNCQKQIVPIQNIQFSICIDVFTQLNVKKVIFLNNLVKRKYSFNVKNSSISNNSV